MWSKLGALYRTLEDDQFRVLADPGALADIPPGWRYKMAAKLAGMPPMERSRLQAFTLRYRGRQLLLALAKPMLLATLCAVATSLLFPEIGMVGAIVGANLVVLGLVFWCYIIYFSHSTLFGSPLHLVLSMSGFGTIGAVSGAIGKGREKGVPFRQIFEQDWLLVLATGFGAMLLFAIPVALMGVLRNRQYKEYSAKLELDAERDRSARELSESRLRLLHAQIEPHFLFNTLGAVQQLAEKNAPEAARLTANLIAFLRASLDKMRSETVTLEADFALVDAYLQVMKTRLGTRLDYTLDLPDGLACVTIPSMMLLTLVENAIKHGIEPALRGGAVHVSARAQGMHLHLSVCDTGPGLGSTPGAGHGLANIMARLKLLHGEAATLSVTDGMEEGVVAVIKLPLAEVTSTRDAT